MTRVDLHATGSRSVVTSGLAGLDNAAFDAENRMFVSSFASGGITELHPDGRTREIVPRGLDGPFGVTVDLAGTVYAADHYRVAGPESGAADAPDGITTHVLRPFAHGISADGGLLHLTSQYGEVTTYDPEHGTTRVRASGLRQPTGIAARPGGGLVVAETGAGRLLALAEDDTVTVLAEGLVHPVDVALDAEGRCYVSDDQLGAVLRIEEGHAFTVADGLDAPQGLAVLGEEVFTVETGCGGCGPSRSPRGGSGSTPRICRSAFPRTPSAAPAPRCSPMACPACRTCSPVSPRLPTAACSSRQTARGPSCD